jgi:acyl carrier protein
MKADEILEMMNQCLNRQGKAPVEHEGQSLQALGFRSLDFSELVLRVEDTLGKELDFDASHLRNIQTVRDVIAFFQKVTA